MAYSIQNLIEQLNDPHADVRQDAAETLAYAALKGEDITLALPALAKAFRDKDTNVKWYAARVLEIFVSNCNSIEKLNEMQAAIKVPELVEYIAERKARLAKEMEREIFPKRVQKPPKNKVKKWIHKLPKRPR